MAILTGLAIGSGLLKFGGAVFEGIGGIREAEEQRRQVERATRFARADARADMRLGMAELDAEDQAMRMQATLQSRQFDLQQQGLTDEATEHAGMSLVSDAMRGVSGQGTQRSMMRGFRERGRAQRGLGLERTAAFSQQRRAETMLGVQRDRMHEQFGRVGRDTVQMEKDAERGVQQAHKQAVAGAAIGAISGAISAGGMLYSGGAFGGNAGADLIGAGGTQWARPSGSNVYEMDRRRLQFN